MKTLFRALVAVALCAPAHAVAGDGVFPFAVHEHTLANGLQVFAIPYDSPGIAAYYTVVRTGSRNEVEKGKSGFAHFFEHMMFRGTPTYSEEGYRRELKLMGADSNAFTTQDLTVYFIVAGSDALPKMVEVEADRFQNLQYTESVFRTEAGAVLGEYNTSISDPGLKISETMKGLAFAHHTYGHTVIGYLDDVKDMPNQYAYSKTFFDRWYRPGNVAVVVAGDVDPARLFALAQQHYGGWKAGSKEPPVPDVEPPQEKEQRAHLDWEGATLPRLTIGYRVPAFSTESTDGPALEVVKELLFADNAPLYRRLVLEQQTVSRLGARYSVRIDPDLFVVSARVKKAADLAAVEKAISDEVARIAREGTDAATLDKVRSHLEYAFAGDLSTADNVALQAAWYLGIGGDIGVINAYYRRLREVTVDDVKRVAATYFTANNRTVVTLSPKPSQPPKEAP